MALNPIAQINYITIASLILIFLITYFVLRKVFFIPLIQVIEQRAAKLEKAHLKKKEAEVLLADARQKAEMIKTETDEEVERLTEAAKEEIAKIREVKIAEANTQADDILTRGREEVSSLKQSEQMRLKDDLCSCASQTLTKLIGKVDEKIVRFTVNKVMTAKGTGR